MIFLTPALLLLPIAVQSANTTAQAVNFGFADQFIQLVDVRSDGLTLACESPNLEIGRIEADGKVYSDVNIAGCRRLDQPGMPSLPVVSRYVALPPRSGVMLEVTVQQSRRLRLTNPLPSAVRQPTDWDGRGDEPMFPSEPAVLTAPVVVRGVRMALLSIYPVQYNLQTSELVSNERIRVDIRFTDAPPVNPVLFDATRRHRSAAFLNVMATLCPELRELYRDEYSDPSPYAGHYLVVAREECLPYAIPFIEWKRASGNLVNILGYPADIAAAADGDSIIKVDIQALYDSYLADGEDPFDYILLLGDRSGNLGSAPWILEAPYGTPSMAVANHADYEYGLLEGNDHYPDVAVGRFSSGNEEMMEIAVARTLAYEKEPWLEDDSWILRGGVYSQRWGEDYNESLPYTTRWGEELLERLGFQEIRVQETDGADDRNGAIIGPVLAEWFNEQVGLMIGRAENIYWRDSFQGVNDNTVFPIFINICGHGEWAMQNMFRSGDLDHLKGPAAMTTGWGIPRTQYNNGFWLALVSGVLAHDMPLGWGRAYAGMMFPVIFGEEALDLMQVYQTDTDLYGDPGIQPWLNIPRQLTVSFPDTIPLSVNSIRVAVSDNRDAPVAGARVTLYQPGELPDPVEYADWQPLFMSTIVTNGNGFANLTLDNQLSEGAVQVTVTGRDVYPFTGEIAVDSPAQYLVLDSAWFDDGGDGRIEPGEQITFYLEAANWGTEQTAGNVFALISSRSPWMEIVDDSISFGNINPGESAIGGGMQLNISPSFHQSPLPILDLQFHSYQVQWSESLPLQVYAPDLQIVEEQLVIPQDDATTLNPLITNVGSDLLALSSAELISGGWAVYVTSKLAGYPAIEIGDTIPAEIGFGVEGNAAAIPGTEAPMYLVIHNEIGWRDTLKFTVQVGEPHENAPQAPDAYGYACFDNTDTGWDFAPQYEWVEISTRIDNDYDGEFISELDNTNDFSVAVELPFTLKFYGEEFNSLTVSSNGFICPGDQSRMISYQNYPLNLAVGAGMGVIAPFWDNLRVRGNFEPSVWYYYREDDGSFIVEWYNVENIAEQGQRLNFQVIIYNSETHPTATGDCQILFQYWQINQVVGSPDVDIPYSSVGISSPDGKTGSSYTYRDQYPITSAPLSSHRAILYTTLPDLNNSVKEEPLQPWEWSLSPNFPNPFNNVTYIGFSLAAPNNVKLQIFDLAGREVAVVRDEPMAVGSHIIAFDGRELPAGIYIYNLNAGGRQYRAKMTLLR